jgi:hypothetical protein
MQEAMGTVMPELQELIQAKDTPEEERQACLRDLDKLQHAGEYYAWLQRFVSGLEEGGGWRGRTARQGVEAGRQLCGNCAASEPYRLSFVSISARGG